MTITQRNKLKENSIIIPNRDYASSIRGKKYFVHSAICSDGRELYFIRVKNLFSLITENLYITSDNCHEFEIFSYYSLNDFL